MVTVKCPHCGQFVIVNLNKCMPEEELAQTVNDIMQGIAMEQGEVECYA